MSLIDIFNIVLSIIAIGGLFGFPICTFLYNTVVKKRTKYNEPTETQVITFKSKRSANRSCKNQQ